MRLCSTEVIKEHQTKYRAFPLFLLFNLLSLQRMPRAEVGPSVKHRSASPKKILLSSAWAYRAIDVGLTYRRDLFVLFFLLPKGPKGGW